MGQGFGSVLIVGAGEGLSASLARAFAAGGAAVALAARRPEKLEALCRETGATAHRCDAAEPGEVERLFAELDSSAAGPPDIAVYNPSFRARGPLIDLDPEDVRRSLAVTAYGAFLVAQATVRRMQPRGRGAVVLTCASAGVKGYPRSAPFAMGKFALRGLAQSMARELHPQGVRVLHLVIDGAIRNPGSREPPDRPDSMLDPDGIARTCLDLLAQPRSAWTWEVEVRPWVETF
jgi:NAD(P)-dependent dehydrogenase (short-subunit alcohol dehydrogenase family)